MSWPMDLTLTTLRYPTNTDNEPVHLACLLKTMISLQHQ